MPELARRRRVLDRALAGPAADLVFAGRETEARAIFAEAIEAGDVPATGAAFLVAAGPGEPDLLTLRALRLLGESDFVVHEPDIGAAILDMARRDAERCPAPDAAAALASTLRLATAGGKVVRLLPGDAPGAVAELAWLTQRGITAEFVPGVAPSLRHPAAID